ncbi:MAG: hypothetical protein ACW98X_17775 [Promethearchaeota archaeon]|jgi:hypothetical protein
MPAFLIKMLTSEFYSPSKIFHAEGYKSAIRKFIEAFQQDIIHTGGSRVQFAVIKEQEDIDLKYFDAYFNWENDKFKCYRIERAG